MAAGLPIEKWVVLLLLAGQSVFSPVRSTPPEFSAKEKLSSLETFKPVVGLTEGMAEQVRSELVQSRSA